MKLQFVSIDLFFFFIYPKAKELINKMILKIKTVNFVGDHALFKIENKKKLSILFITQFFYQNKKAFFFCFNYD